jgi:hypothetical protein
MYGKRTSRTLNVIEQGFAVIGVALIISGAALAALGHRDEGISTMFVALIFGGLWLVVHLYRGRYSV